MAGSKAPFGHIDYIFLKILVKTILCIKSEEKSFFEKIQGFLVGWLFPSHRISFIQCNRSKSFFMNIFQKVPKNSSIFPINPKKHMKVYKSNKKTISYRNCGSVTPILRKYQNSQLVLKFPMLLLCKRIGHNSFFQVSIGNCLLKQKYSIKETMVFCIAFHSRDPKKFETCSGFWIISTIKPKHIRNHQFLLSSTKVSIGSFTLIAVNSMPMSTTFVFAPQPWSSQNSKKC